MTWVNPALMSLEGDRAASSVSVRCTFRPVHDDGYFDERIAATYDADSAEMFDPDGLEPVVDFLAELAGDGRALELGIGTGRVALPLVQRGVNGPRDRAVEGDGGEAAREAGR